MIVKATWIVLFCMQSITADVYLHVPRGSNNRLNENTANRNNANRMFDSQVSFFFSVYSGFKGVHHLSYKQTYQNSSHI